MPSTVVHAGFAVLLAAGLLTDAFDRRALAVLLVVVVAPEADTVAGLWMDGAHRALFHNLTMPLVVVALLYWDTRYRERSWLRERFDRRGVRIAWVAVFVHCFAHLLLDYAHLEGINALYPVYDRFVRLEGELLYSTAEGVVQTFVEIDLGADGGEESAVDVGTTGTTNDTHVANPVEPDPPDPEPTPEEPDDEPFELLLPIADSGWELYMVLSGAFVLAARRFQDRSESE